MVDLTVDEAEDKIRSDDEDPVEAEEPKTRRGRDAVSASSVWSSDDRRTSALAWPRDLPLIRASSEGGDTEGEWGGVTDFFFDGDRDRDRVWRGERLEPGELDGEIVCGDAVLKLPECVGPNSEPELLCDNSAEAESTATSGAVIGVEDERRGIGVAEPGVFIFVTGARAFMIVPRPLEGNVVVIPRGLGSSGGLLESSNSDCGAS